WTRGFSRVWRFHCGAEWHSAARCTARSDAYWSLKTGSASLPMEAKNSTDFTVVCVGGSAGGLDAYTRLLRHLPADMGVAIVIVNHLRTVATRLHEILPRYTKMPVELITEKLLIEPDRVYIIPEQRDLHVLKGEFRL